jgi:hypothetical protein
MAASHHRQAEGKCRLLKIAATISMNSTDPANNSGTAVAMIKTARNVVIYNLLQMQLSSTPPKIPA